MSTVAFLVRNTIVKITIFFFFFFAVLNIFIDLCSHGLGKYVHEAMKPQNIISSISFAFQYVLQYSVQLCITTTHTHTHTKILPHCLLMLLTLLYPVSLWDMCG